MTHPNTSSALFWLKLAITQNKKAPLYARIAVNNKGSELSLKRKVLKKKSGNFFSIL